MVEFYNQITSETGSRVTENDWKASGICDASALPAFDPFQYILPLPVADDGYNACGISIPVNVPSEVKDGFININEDVGNDNDEEFCDWEHYK